MNINKTYSCRIKNIIKNGERTVQQEIGSEWRKKIEYFQLIPQFVCILHPDVLQWTFRIWTNYIK